ncbi:glycosyltransferase [uncultured Maribacter sp.]|uniref:glycosyltransferase n=1 Tax=uncultured Maribacter sp. TaxID=431308 RepID=UPI002611A47E|nr:glycosyltransferase [uncultured Maribacter sp.]
MKTKILFILTLPPPIHGASLMGKYIQESKSITNEFDCTFINSQTSKDLKDIGKGFFKKAIVILKLNFKIFYVLMFNKFDFCYLTLTSNGPGFYKDLLIILILKLFRKKIIYHFHNKGVHKYNSTKINNLLYEFALKNSKSILLSPNLFIDIKKYVAEENVYYCANGIPEINYEIKEKASSANKLLFFSNMMKLKGVYVLLEACNILKNKGVDFHCDFVGDFLDIDKNTFNKKIKENCLTNHVFVHGAKFGDEKHYFYQQADIFVLPTLNDCFPLVLLEAMQFSLPIISTNEGGIPDIITQNETGIIIEKNNAKALANKIEYLINNPKIKNEMGNLGRKKYSNNYTLPFFEKKLITILNLKKTIN